MFSMVLKPQEPFDFERTLRFILSPPALLNGRVFAPLLDYFVDGEYRRVVEVGGQQVLYGVRERRRGAAPKLEFRVLAGPEDHRTVAAVRHTIVRQFATDLDLGPFYRLSQSDPVLVRLTDRFVGMRVAQSGSVFETLVSAIIEQQVNLSFAHQVKRALVETYGSAVEYGGRRYNAFPDPAALAITTASQLRRLQVSGPKARYIVGIAQAVLDGSLDGEALRGIAP